MVELHRVQDPDEAARKALDDVRFQRSLLTYKIAVIENELKKVSLGKVKLPILNHEVPTNDASVVLGFFLVIISLVALVTVKHINDALADRRLLRMVRQDMVLLRSRLILIYAPMGTGLATAFVWLIFFMPLIATLVTLGETLYYLCNPDYVDARRMRNEVYLRATLLFLMSAFLAYVGYSLLAGWRNLRDKLAE